MKRLKKLLFIILGIGILYAVSILFLILSEKKDTPADNPDTVLILGAQVNGTSSKNAYPSPVLKERLDTAVSYLEQQPQAVVIVCGGKGPDEPDTEARVMADYLIKNGIPEKQILIEGESTRTKENIQNAQKKRKLGKTVIITSDFHMYRSKLLAKRLGVTEVSGLPAASCTSATIKSYIREICALGYGIIFDH